MEINITIFLSMSIKDTSAYVLDIFYDAVEIENIQIYLFGDRMQQIYKIMMVHLKERLKKFDTFRSAWN